MIVIQAAAAGHHCLLLRLPRRFLIYKPGFLSLSVNFIVMGRKRVSMRRVVRELEAAEGLLLLKHIVPAIHCSNDSVHSGRYGLVYRRRNRNPRRRQCQGSPIAFPEGCCNVPLSCNCAEAVLYTPAEVLAMLGDD